MNVSDAVRQRRSIRDFRSDAVPQALLADILDTARWAPSGSNIQAWRIIAVTGAERDAVVQITRKAPASAGFGKTDDPYPIYPPELWEPLRTRRYTLAEDMYRALGIPRDDKPARFQHVARNFEFFGAPVGLFFVLDQRVVHGQWAHLGMLIQTVALLLEERGLGSCMQEAWASYRAELAAHFQLAPNEMIYCGMSVGFPALDKPVNQFPRSRMSLDELVEFQGF